MKSICEAWEELAKMTEKLTSTIAQVPANSEMDMAALENLFNEFRENNQTKVELLKVL